MNKQDDQALTMTVHAMPDAAVDAPARRPGRLKMFLIMLACAAPVIASYTMYFVVRPDGRTNNAVLLSPTLEWPKDLPLRSLDGQPVAAASLRGQWLLVALTDAACNADCEKRLYTQRQLREMLGKERDRLDKVVIVLDEAPMRAEAQQSLAMAPAATVLRAPRAGMAAWLKHDAARLEDALYVVDPMGQWMMQVPMTLEPSKVKRDLDRLLKASSSWDRSGR